MATASNTRQIATFLESIGVARTIVHYQRGAAIFAQGEICANTWHIELGTVKLSVTSPAGKQAVVAVLGPGEFFGETCLAGLPAHLSSATAMTRITVVKIPKQQMQKLLHQHHAPSDRFVAHMLARNLRIEEDLIDHLFNSSEKRLARTLLLLARYGHPEAPEHVIPKMSQETLAAMVGTTRSRVSIFLNRFKRRGFIAYGRGRSLRINRSLLTIVLRS